MDQQNLIKQEAYSHKEFYDGSIEMLKEEVSIDAETYLYLNTFIGNTKSKTPILINQYDNVQTGSSLHECIHCDKQFARKYNFET